jgi:DNA mismatch repair protein MutS
MNIKTENTLISEYLKNQEKYTNIYGSNTIFLMQVGSFFEAYQTLDEGYDLNKLSNILNMVVSKKNKSIATIDRKNPYLLGFPCVAKSKYIKILVENGYTIIIMEQVSDPPNPKREITDIISPGTFIEEINKPDSNYILTIYLEEIKNKKINYISGLSLIESSTGYIKLHETFSIKDDENISLDEIVKFIKSYSPSEILIITSEITDIKYIINYLELGNKNYTHKTLQEFKNLKGNNNIFKISYQNDFLKNIYNIKYAPFEYLEIEKLNYARDVLVMSLHYLLVHNNKLIKKIQKPEIYIKENKMHLGNNPIFQLDIFNNNNETQNIYSIDNSYKCLFDIINKTCTPMGKRYLKNILIEPIIDCDELITRYDIIEYLQQNDEKYDNILNEIKDVERLERKIAILNIHPYEFKMWIIFQESIKKIIEIINNDQNLENMLSNITNINIQDLNNGLKKMMNTINITFNLDELKYNINEIETNIFLHKYTDIINLELSINTCTNFMTILGNKLNDILNRITNKSKNNEKYITINNNDRDGYFLILSKRRAEILENELQKQQILKIEINRIEIEIKTSMLKFKHADKGTTSKIICEEIEQNSDKILEYKEEIKKLSKEYFNKEINLLFTEYEKIIYNSTKIITLFDFFLSGSKVANKFYYNKPIISNKYNDKSWFKAIQLRHPIIERINKDTEYIPTDIELGTEKQDGILLFGLNSAGKSTLQKAIGISVLLAQIGYFVPALQYIYYPYKSLLTRISCNDNMFKGLSSFTFELMELSTIIKRSNKNTLVIADEICKGTEHESSLIIVMTILKMLSENKTSFITATHLHEIIEMKEIKEIENIKKYHLHVEFDENNNKLYYDRTLKEGTGTNFYGYDIAKYLINDKKFNEYSTEISKNFKINYNSDKKSRYNSKIFINECAICHKIPKSNELPLETHHINFQKNCDNNGFINNKKYLHKNHKSNLVILCKSCHLNIDKHLDIYGYKETLYGKELNIRNKKINEIEKKLDNELSNFYYKLLNKKY